MKSYLSLLIGIFLILLLLPCVLSAAPFSSQQKIFYLTNGRQSVSIPFRLIHNLIVVPVVLEGKCKLNLILDTGTTSPVIFNQEYLQELEVPMGRSVTFYGAGKGKAVRGKVISGISMHLAGAATERIGMVVLQSNPFEKLVIEGTTIHGVLGTQLFSSFIVEIDFPGQRLHLYEQQSFVPEAGYQQLPLQLWSGKPVIPASVQINGITTPVNLMVDTGFNNTLLLYNYEDSPVQLPAKVRRRRIGSGYSGDIFSKTGFSQHIQIGKTVVDHIFTIFPKAEFFRLGKADRAGERHGAIGNELLKSFRIGFNYVSGIFYIRPDNSRETAPMLAASEIARDMADTPSASGSEKQIP